MKKHVWRAALCAVVFLFLLGAAVPVYADMGPKPGTTIVVENPPDVYYLDLLIPDEEYELYSNLTEEERAACDPEMLAVLEAQRSDGWHTALVTGTAAPLFGALTGSPREDGMAHTFSYYGVPDAYRILVVTEDLQVFCSDILVKKGFQETLHVRLDVEKGSIVVTKSPSVPLMYVRQFATTFIPTLLVEFLILLLFRIPVKKNLLVFFGVNLATQLLLTVIMTQALRSSGLITAYLILIPLELAILAVEMTIYAFLLQGVSKRRRMAYAATANIVSAVLGFILTGVCDSFINML